LESDVEKSLGAVGDEERRKALALPDCLPDLEGDSAVVGLEELSVRRALVAGHID